MKIFKNTTLLLCFLVAFTACKKDKNILGVDGQPEIDGLNASVCDTAIITAFTKKYDSIATFNDKLKYLGSNQDPTFGRMDVGLYLNANIPNGVTFVSFGDDANLVSSEIILTVNTINFIGDQSTPLTYSVFALDSALDNSRLYFTNKTNLHNKNSLLGVYTGTYSVLDSKLVLRIPIDNNFAKSILNNPQYLVDNSTFLSKYKGFYITAAGSSLNPGTTPGSQGVIAHFNLEDPLSGFYLRYQKGTPSATKEDLTFRFQFSGSNALRFNTVKFNTSSGNYLLHNQLNGDSVLGNQNLFLKGLGATRIKFKIPFLDYLKNYSDTVPLAINRAEFSFHVDPSFLGVVGTGVYYTPPKLALLPLDSTGKETYAIDQLSQTDFDLRYGGDYDATNNRYVFNIARHVQAILNKERKNWGFHLVVADPERSEVIRRDNMAERVVLAGNNNPALRPKFKVTYIKYKHDK